MQNINTSDKYHRTHEYFFHVITRNKLNELYKRVEDKNILESCINTLLNSELKNAYCRVDIVNCSIYFNYFIAGKKVGHLSLHIGPVNRELIGLPKEYGRFHISNNKSRNRPRYSMKITKNKNSTQLVVSYNTRKYMVNNLKIFSNITLNVLHTYFNPTSSEYLGNYNTKYVHKCTDIIDNLYKSKTRESLRTTRKKQSVFKIK